MVPFVFSSKLLSFPELNHGFSTKASKKTIEGFYLNQIHSDIIIQADAKSDMVDGDGIVTDTPGLTIAVKTADCVPILLYEYKKGIIGVVHAGWMGTSKQIVQNVVSKIIEMGGHAENIIICLGPSIGECCYSVEKTRLEYFKEKEIINKRNNKYYLNLKKANTQQLLNMNVPQENIESLHWCTSCHNDMFYSSRKGASLIERNISFIELR